jgi:hypothetical protein
MQYGNWSIARHRIGARHGIGARHRIGARHDPYSPCARDGGTRGSQRTSHPLADRGEPCPYDRSPSFALYLDGGMVCVLCLALPHYIITCIGNKDLNRHCMLLDISPFSDEQYTGKEIICHFKFKLLLTLGWLSRSTCILWGADCLIFPVLRREWREHSQF